MRFKRILLDGVLAYDRPAEFIFPLVEDRNIVLIWGRNGMGKTSFLRAVKLLFLGVGPPRVREIGSPPRVLSERQFVVGDGAGWSGLINRQAARRASQDGRAPTASIVATWTDDGGAEITAERRWVATVGGYQEHAVVYDGVQRLAGEAAADRIGDLMPPEFVDYFFFDGEDIKAIAESEGVHQQEIDRLLRITFVTELGGELSRLRTERQRRDMTGEALREYTNVEAALVRTRGDLALARQTVSALNETLSVDAAQLRRLYVRRENLSSGASDAQRGALEKRRTELNQSIEDITEQVAQKIPAASPLVANLSLVRSALAAADQRVASASQAEERFLGRVAGRLPEWLVETRAAEPGAAPGVAAKLVDRMRGELPRGSGGPFSSLDPMRAQRLREMLSRFANSGEDVLRAHATQLEALRRDQRELGEVREALLRIEVGSQANIEQYRAVVREIEELEARQTDQQMRKGQQLERIDEAQREIAKLESDLAVLAERQQLAARQKREAQFISKVEGALNELGEVIRQAVRGRLVERLNARFHELVTQHPLVDRVTLDEGYTMTFLDDAGREVGRSSLSSGLKQLAATALLWALKDVSGVDMPVIIDTPLGRIDRENQDNMLNHYYPQLAQQVIVLPTNSEIDQRRFDLIRDRVAGQFKIVNETGDSATVEPGGSLVQA